MHVRNWMRAVVGTTVLGSVAALGAPPAKPDVSAGKAIYQRECVNCHGPAGKGDGDDAAYYTTKPTDLTTLSKRSDDFLAAVISGGGPAKGLSKDMPAVKLSPSDLQSVVAYVRSLSATKSGK